MSRAQSVTGRSATYETKTRDMQVRLCRGRNVVWVVKKWRGWGTTACASNETKRVLDFWSRQALECWEQQARSTSGSGKYRDGLRN